MVRRRREATAFDIRLRLAERDRWYARRFDEHLPDFSGAAYHRRAAALEAGEPVEVYRWEVQKWLPPGAATTGSYRAVLEPDGTLTPISRSRPGA